MQLVLVKALVRPILEEGRISGYIHLRNQVSQIYIKECALTRAYQNAMDCGRMSPGDLVQVSFVDEDGNHVPTTEQVSPAYHQFWQRTPDLHVLATSQSMAAHGKMIASKKPLNEAIVALWGQDFLNRVDLHKFFKIMQIALQPGRLLGDIEVQGQLKPTEPVKPFEVTVLMDEKRDDEDGMIFVRESTWPQLMECYSTMNHPLGNDVTLVKVNTMVSWLTIKGVLQRIPDEQFITMLEGRTKHDNPEDIQVILCGNAVKDNVCLEPGQVYDLDQSFFAYHDDSSNQNGYRVNVSKQLQVRSGWDNAYFIEKTCGPVFKTLQGLCSFDEETVLRVIGAFDAEGEVASLDNDTAVKTRILEHHLPANHPTNAVQIMRRTMSYIRDHLTKVDTPGFHGMGAVSHMGPGIVLVPERAYKQFQKHGSNQAYLFRMPYLGNYCGMYVTVHPADTDTIHVNWEDALQMEGDFDGDNYYVIPASLISCPEVGSKPERSTKRDKDKSPLTESSVASTIVELTNNKVGIGNRDTLLSAAYDWYHYYKAASSRMYMIPTVAEDARSSMQTWKQNISRIQVYVQQAVEGLKHTADEQISEAEIKALFTDSMDTHPYTQTLAKANFSGRVALQGTQTTLGYLDLVRGALSVDHAWHPLHSIISNLAQLQVAPICDVLPYWKAVEGQRTRILASDNIRPLFSALRHIMRTYTDNVKRWNGGRNKNMSFGKDVLGPVREMWEKVVGLADGHEQQPAIYRDLCLLLAKVAYEPQPNWEMVGKDERYSLGVLTRIGRDAEFIDLIPASTVEDIGLARKNDHKPLCDGIVTKSINGRTYHIRLWLPRPGSLFHHLVEPFVSVDILKEALPTIDFDGLLVKALYNEFV